MNPYLVIILAALVGRWILEWAADVLNLRHITPRVPEEFADVMDAEKYARSQQYLRVRTRFGMVEDAVRTPLIVLAICLGAFQAADAFARGLGGAPIPTGLAFAGLIGMVAYVLGLPFTLYDTFVIEERFGFNRITWRTDRKSTRLNSSHYS